MGGGAAGGGGGVADGATAALTAPAGDDLQRYLTGAPVSRQGNPFQTSCRSEGEDGLAGLQGEAGIEA